MDETYLLWNSLGHELQAYLDAVRPGLPFPTDEYSVLLFIGHFADNDDFLASGATESGFDRLREMEYVLIDFERLDEMVKADYAKSGDRGPSYFVAYVCHNQGADKIIASKRTLAFMLLYSNGETNLVRLDGKGKENLDGRLWKNPLSLRVIG